MGLGATGEAAAAGAVSGGAPVMEGERGQAGKLQHDEENLFRELAWAEKDRRWWRGGELSAAAMAGCSGKLCFGELMAGAAVWQLREVP